MIDLRARIARAVVRSGVNRVPVHVTFPDGSNWGAGGPDSPHMHIVRPDQFFARLGADQRIGFGEAYMAGDWVTGGDTDLADLLTPFAERLTSIVPPSLQKFRALVDERLPLASRNSVPGARRNIEAHYDLSNEMFALFLDETMSYSSALFARDADAKLLAEPLEVAQLRKIDAVLDQAEVTADSRVLEIGTGWGSLAIRAAQRGARVTTITISAEQATLAAKRVADAGVSDLVDVQLIDYRDVSGSYDAIVSVEMIEAVGEEYWPVYFSTINRLLEPGSKVSIQAITMADERYRATRNSYGWIQKYIFPGGMIPSVEAIEATLTEHTSLHLSDQRSFGRDYAATLRLWRRNFEQNWPLIQAAGFDQRFASMWEFYLAYCEAGFATGYLNVRQLQLESRRG